MQPNVVLLHTWAFFTYVFAPLAVSNACSSCLACMRLHHDGAWRAVLPCMLTLWRPVDHVISWRSLNVKLLS